MHLGNSLRVCRLRTGAEERSLKTCGSQVFKVSVYVFLACLFILFFFFLIKEVYKSLVCNKQLPDFFCQNGAAIKLEKNWVLSMHGKCVFVEKFKVSLIL